MAKDAQHEVEAEFDKRYTLPAILSTPSSSVSEGHLLKLGFLNGEIIIVKARSEGDWNDLLRCLGPVRYNFRRNAGKLLMASGCT